MAPLGHPVIRTGVPPRAAGTGPTSAGRECGSKGPVGCRRLLRNALCVKPPPGRRGHKAVQTAAATEELGAGLLDAEMDGGAVPAKPVGQRQLVREVQRLEMEGWLLGRQKKPAKKVSVPEDSEKHFDYLQRIALKAQVGDVLGVERILEEFQFPEDGKGLALGPRAYHGLVYAQIKAEDVSGALDTWRHAYISGIETLPETVTVLVKGIFKTGRPSAQALALLNCVEKDQGNRAEIVWREVIVGLFKAGYDVDAEEELIDGMRKKWKPNHEMYAALIANLCSRDKEQSIEQAHEWLRRMTESGLLAVEEHMLPVIEGYLRFQRPDAATDIFKATGMAGFGPPTTNISNAILGGAGDHLINTGTLSDDFAKMKKHNALPDIQVFLYVLFSSLANRYGTSNWVSVMDSYPDIFAADGPLSDDVVSMLFESVLVSEDPDLLLLLLEELHLHGRQLPQVATKMVSGGLTIVAGFLKGHIMDVQSQVTGLHESKVDEFEEPEIVKMDGVLIGVGSCIVDEEGNVKAPSKLTVGELRTELRARGLSDEGLRPDLYKRIQAARRNDPQAVKEQARRRSDKKKEEKKVQDDMKRVKAATTFLDHKLTWNHFKADKFGDLYCYYTESKSIHDLEKEYYLTAQSRKIWGIPRPGVSIGTEQEVDWSELPDPYVPEDMSVEEVSEMLWQYAKEEGITPAYWRSLLDPESDVPLPKEVQERTKVKMLEDGTEMIVDVEEEEEDAPEPVEEDEGGELQEAEADMIGGVGGSNQLAGLQENMWVQKATAIAKAAEEYFGLLPSEADVALMVQIVSMGHQTSDVPVVVELLERHGSRFDVAALRKMFHSLVQMCVEAGDVRLAYETFSAMINAGVPRDTAADNLELSIQAAELQAEAAAHD